MPDIAAEPPRFRIIRYRLGNGDARQVPLTTPIDVAHLPGDTEMRRLIGTELPDGRVYPVYLLLPGGDEHRHCPICHPPSVVARGDKAAVDADRRRRELGNWPGVRAS